MIYLKIEKLLPYINENFITFPLWEEGKYIPFINFWQKYETQEDYEKHYKKLKKHFNKTGYVVVETDVSGGDIVYYELYPDFKEFKNGDFKYKKYDWSIEDMLDKLNEVLK